MLIKKSDMSLISDSQVALAIAEVSVMHPDYHYIAAGARLNVALHLDVHFNDKFHAAFDRAIKMEYPAPICWLGNEDEILKFHP